MFPRLPFPLRFVDSLDMRPQALEQWQQLVHAEAAASVPAARASASMLRVAALLWRGGGEADGQAAAKPVAPAVKQAVKPVASEDKKD